MDLNDILGQPRDGAMVKRVFGDPYEKDGVTLIPVARIMHGGGGGTGTDQEREGGGGGFGLVARPVGVYRVEDGKVTWEPAIDVTRVIFGGQIVGIVALLVIRSIFKRRRRG